MNAESTGVRRRALGVSMVIASALHVVVLGGIDLPERPSRGAWQRLPAIELTLSDYKHPAALPEPATAEVAAPPVASLTVSRPDAIRDQAVEPSAEPVPAPPPLAGKSIAELAHAVATLEATRATANQPGSAPAPRVRRLGEAPVGDVEFDFYLESWRRKVERIGNLNYPRQARERGLTGSLRLLAVIAADGTLSEVRVLQGSGHPELDEAATRIVRLAAPYSPFPPRLRETTDLLEIERTWQFRNNRVAPRG